MKYFLPLLLLLPYIGQSNGGPIDESYLYSTGHIQLKNEASINLLQEDLVIQFGADDWCTVNVAYTVQNKGDLTPITYGFPISLLDAHDSYSGDSVVHTSYIEGFSISVDGQSLNTRTMIGEKKAHNDESTAVLGWEDVIDIWYISNFDVPAKSTFKIEVSYKVRPMYSDWATSKSPLPGYSRRHFRYDLSPASSWGDSYIQNFRMKLDFSKMMNYDPTILIGGYPDMIIPKSGVLEFETDFYHLSDSSLLTIGYKYNKLQQLFEEKNIMDKVVSVDASSSLENYPVKNILDQDRTTAWVEGKDGLGVGEFIEIRFSEPIDLDALGIALGYQKSPELYRANGIPLKLKFELFLGDQSTEHTVQPNVSPENTQIHHSAYRYAWFSIYSELEKADKIKITILDAKTGLKYEDVCISDVLLLDQW